MGRKVDIGFNIDSKRPIRHLDNLLAKFKELNKVHKEVAPNGTIKFKVDSTNSEKSLSTLESLLEKNNKELLKIAKNTKTTSKEFDKLKNRAYLTFSGFCSKPSDMPNFLDDVKKATQGLTRAFTLLTDVTKLKTPPKDVGELHIKSQEIWIQSGLSKTAEILPETTIEKLAVDRYSRITGMKKEWFTNKTEAEAWHDEK